MLAMDHKQELLAQLAAQIAAGMVSRIAFGVPVDEKHVVSTSTNIAKAILTEARGTPISFFG
jgi:hypothetical protein